MFRIVAAIVLVAVLAVGGGIIATTAYQAGVAATVTTAAAAAGAVVAPVVVPAYGYGWGGPGFGFFGFLFALFFLFVVLGLIRAVVFGGRHGGRWDGHGWDAAERDTRMRSRFHGTFEDWHREAHATDDRPPAGPPATPSA
jgi:hypothetical protein